MAWNEWIQRILRDYTIQQMAQGQLVIQIEENKNGNLIHKHQFQVDQ